MENHGVPITLQLKAARLTRDTAIVKMDPYCVVWLGNQSARTSTDHLGGKTPRWNDVMTLFRNQEDRIRFLVYDKDTLDADAFIAEGEFNFSMFQGGAFEEWIPLRFAGKSAGELQVNIMMQPGVVGHMKEAIVEEGQHLEHQVKGMFSSEPEHKMPAVLYPAH
jgi:hypothetical protein